MWGISKVIGTSEQRLAELDRLYPVWEEHTVWTMFRKVCGRVPSYPLVITENRSYTYHEAKRQAERIAAAMVHMGIRTGQHVALRLHNCPEYLFMSLALSKIGAVKVPLHLKAGAECRNLVLEQADVDWFFTVSEQTGSACFTVENGIWMRYIQKKLFPVASWKEFCGLCDACVGEDADNTIAAYGSRELSDIMFTSGSTSLPKGVMLTSDMLLRSAYASCRTRRMEPGRRIYVPIPFYHAFAYVEGFLAALLVEGCLIISEHRFTAEHGLELMRRFQAEDIVCISGMMMDILSRGKPEPEAYPKLHAAYWASSCPDWVWEEGRRRFGITDITTGYGMTECGSTTFMLSPDDPPSFVSSCHGRLKGAGSAGSARYDGYLLEVRICDPDSGRVLSEKETGELQCRGFTVTPGYYHNDAANAAAFTADGWFRTGDLCQALPDGRFAFRGRTDDMYKINGENVSPAYVDKVLEGCPHVRALQTVGIPHPKYGAVGVAFLDTDRTVDQMRPILFAYCEAHLAAYQIPKYFIWSRLETWPFTQTGKVAKRRLQAAAAEWLNGGSCEMCEYCPSETLKREAG